jgi:hypothetical protein
MLTPGVPAAPPLDLQKGFALLIYSRGMLGYAPTDTDDYSTLRTNNRLRFGLYLRFLRTLAANLFADEPLIPFASN